jgi:RimJ/RimL family protein N-acetyltransferase
MYKNLPSESDGTAFLGSTGETMLETERLIIRPFRESDYADLFEYLSIKETYRFEPGEPVSMEEAKEYAKKRSNSVNWWAATLKNDTRDKLIGHISLFQTEPKVLRTWEIGYIFNPAFQNKGYASEAAYAVIKHVFEKLNAHRIIAHCSPENIPSRKVLEKCGMTREGLQRKNVFFRTDDEGNPLWFDSFDYAILADDER